METKQQIDHLIELAIVQRAELKRLVEQLPVLRTYLLEQINATIEDMEPQLRSDLIEFCDEKTDGKIKEIRSFFSEAKSEFATKSEAFFVELEKGVQARYAQLAQERALALDFADDARKGLEAAAQQEAAKIPGQVSELVKQELARFPRAGELDQLRKEFSEPRGLNPRGKWKSTETYQKLDLVAYNGDSYVSNVNDNREKPSRSSLSWTLSAARGQGSGGGGISSLNDILGAPTSDFDVVGAEGSNYVRKTLTAGTNVTLEETPTTITINASDVAAQTLTATVVNAESVAITRGQVVYAFAATGNKVSVKLASNSAESTSAKTFGIVSDDSIAAGATGTVTCVGVVDKLNLGTYSEGATVYLGSTAGTFTATKPYAPNHLVYVGIVQRANNGNGQLYVKIQNGYELDEIHDVQITAPKLAGQTILYDQTNSLWKNANIAGTANQITVTNADAAVTLSLPTTITNVNSITASSATNLTLNGGSSGASIVAGQGTNANVTLTPSGTGSVTTPGILKTTNTTASTSTTTGALVVSGGLGVAGAIYADGQVLSGSGLSITGSSSTVLGIGFGNSPLAYGTALIRSQNDFRIVDDGFFNIQRLTTKILTISNPNNNVLIGTATDSSNGKLQLATHTTSAGGIGFGTDTSLYRSATGAGTLELNAASGSTSLLSFALAGTKKAQIGISASNSYFDYDGSLIFRAGVGGTTTLTLDSSQNATFAGLIGIAGNTLRGVGKVYNSATGDAYGLEQVSGSQNTGNQSRAALRFFSPSGQGSEFDFGYYSDASTFNTHTRINTTGITTTGSLTVSNTTDSSSTTTGALVVSGGLGVAKKATFGGGINGTTTNDSAAAGCVGEYVSSIIASGSAISLTNNTVTNITSISLTAGDWDVDGVVVFTPDTTTVRTRSIGAFNTTSASLPATYYRSTLTLGTADAAGETYGGPVPIQRISLSATTTVYLMAYAQFSAGNQTAHGYISARRVR